jgi:hypothetical protein
VDEQGLTDRQEGYHDDAGEDGVGYKVPLLEGLLDALPVHLLLLGHLAHELFIVSSLSSAARSKFSWMASISFDLLFVHHAGAERVWKNLAWARTATVRVPLIHRPSVSPPDKYPPEVLHPLICHARLDRGDALFTRLFTGVRGRGILRSS